MKKATSRTLTRKQMAELKALAEMPDDAIDTSDIPEVTDWAGARRGVFYRPVKQQLTLRLDADVIAWFKRKGDGYQTRMNDVLRAHAGKAQRRGRGKQAGQSAGARSSR